MNLDSDSKIKKNPPFRQQLKHFIYPTLVGFVSSQSELGFFVGSSSNSFSGLKTLRRQSEV